MYDKFQGFTVDVQVATLIFNNPRANHEILMLSVLDLRFQTGTVNFHAHAFNLNNQYHTLLKVYKPVA